MWPPHSVKTWPTPACLRTRATSSPPVTSATRPLHSEARPGRRGPSPATSCGSHFNHRRAELLQPPQLVEQAPHQRAGRDGRRLPPRAAHQLAAAVGARLAHRAGAGGAERALVAAHERLGGQAERAAALLAPLTHLQRHRRTPYQNFSHFTALRSMPLAISAARTALIVASPPAT